MEKSGDPKQAVTEYALGRETSVFTLSGRGIALAFATAAISGLVMPDAWRDILRLALVDEELNYILLAPVVIGWLMWVRRRRLAQCPVWGGWIGILMLVIGCVVYWYGYFTDPVLWRAGAVLAMVGAFVSVTGFGLVLRWMPALAATVFLIPIDPNGRYHVAGPLQEVTARLSQDMCDVVGIAVSRSGNFLSVNDVGVTVAEACNGMRMILTLFLVCYVVAFSIPLRGYVRVLFLLATPFVAIVSNVVRLVPTLWMFGHRSSQAAERFHDVSGWVMTVVAFALLMGFFRLLRWATDAAIYRPQYF